MVKDICIPTITLPSFVPGPCLVQSCLCINKLTSPMPKCHPQQLSLVLSTAFPPFSLSYLPPNSSSLYFSDRFPSQAWISKFSDMTVCWLGLVELLPSMTGAPSFPGTPPALSPALPEINAPGFHWCWSFSPEVGLKTSPRSGLQVLHEDCQLHSFEKAASASNLISEGLDVEDWDVFSNAGFGAWTTRISISSGLSSDWYLSLHFWSCLLMDSPCIGTLMKVCECYY